MRKSQVDVSFRRSRPIFILFGQASVLAQPREGALYYPSARQRLEPSHSSLSQDHFHLPPKLFCYPLLQQPIPVAVIGSYLLHTRQLLQRVRLCSLIQQQPRSISILNISSMHYNLVQQPFRVYQQVAFSTFHLLAIVISFMSRWPPFSVLLTAWLSITTMEGSGLRPLATLYSVRSTSFSCSKNPASLSKEKYQCTLLNGGRS